MNQKQNEKEAKKNQPNSLSGQVLAFTSFLHAPYAAKPLRNALGLAKEPISWGLTDRLSTPIKELVQAVIDKDFKELAHLNTDCLARGIAFPLGDSKFCLVAGNYKNRYTPNLSYWVLDIEKHVQQSEFSPATRKEPNKPIWVAMYETSTFGFDELAACEITEPPPMLKLIPELGHDDLLDPICFFHEKTKTLIFSPSLLCQLGSSVFHLELAKSPGANAQSIKSVLNYEINELTNILHRKEKTSLLSRILGRSDNLYGVRRLKNAVGEIKSNSKKLQVKLSDCHVLNLGLLARDTQLTLNAEHHLLESPQRYARLSLSDEYTAQPTLETIEAFGLVGPDRGVGTNLIAAMQYRDIPFASQELLEDESLAQDILQKIQQIEGSDDGQVAAARLNVAPAAELMLFIRDAFAPGYSRYDELREKLHYKTLSPREKLKATLK